MTPTGPGSPAKPKMTKGGWIVLAIVAVIIVAAISGHGGKKSAGNSAPAADSPASADPTTAAPVVAAPVTLLDVSGKGQHQTQKFTAAGDWDLNYSYDCTAFDATSGGNFQVYIYNSDGTGSVDNSGVNELGVKGQDVTHEHTGGTFYLSMNSECTWHVVVQG